jgi:cytochrome b561
VLWRAQVILALLLYAVILVHVAAALFHALVRRDGVFEAMGPDGGMAKPFPRLVYCN